MRNPVARPPARDLTERRDCVDAHAVGKLRMAKKDNEAGPVSQADYETLAAMLDERFNAELPERFTS